MIERKTATSTTGHGFLDNLPSVTVGGVRAHELTTTRGSALTCHADGTTYVLAGSPPSATLECALSRKSANRMNLTHHPSLLLAGLAAASRHRTFATWFRTL